MPPSFVIPETTVNAPGESVPLVLSEPAGPLLLTFGITKVIEQESVDLLVLGSADGASWSKLAAFPQKFYTGVSTLVLDLTKHPETRFLRAQWKLNRWGRGEKTPSFTFYVVAEPMN
jgi:hypothetical protein